VAMAEASPANAMTCVKPFTIPDKWIEKNPVTKPWETTDGFSRYGKKGVLLSPADVYEPAYYDADGTHDLTVTLRGYTHGTPDTGGSPSFFDAGSVSSAGCCGTGYASSPTSHTVENDAAHDPAAAQLVVLVDLPAATSNLGFKGVDLRWARQVSAAPAAATFADVPASDGAFAFVEALAASGVTAGCGGGNYCPDAPLTRSQMAVFLSKALGLYWPD